MGDSSPPLRTRRTGVGASQVLLTESDVFAGNALAVVKWLQLTLPQTSFILLRPTVKRDARGVGAGAGVGHVSRSARARLAAAHRGLLLRRRRSRRAAPSPALPALPALPAWLVPAMLAC